MPRRLGAILPLLAAGLVPPAAAVCTPGATTLAVPGDCATVAAAVGAIAEGGTIELPAGTAPLGGLPLVLSNLGKSLTLRAPAAGATTFSGGGGAPIVVVENASAASGRPIVFEGIRFANGRSATENRGGAVTLLRAEATFADCVFEDNAHVGTTTGGGALALLAGSRALVVRGSFAGNSARNAGGAIYAVRNDGQPAASLWLAESELTGNSTGLPGFTATAAGGALYARNVSVRIADSRFAGNVAGHSGGAIYAIGGWSAGTPACDFGAPAADLLVARTSFLDNRADDAADSSPKQVGQTVGGALHVERCARLRLYASELERNQADKGGAISVEHARLVAEQTVFRHNRARLADVDVAPTGGALAAFSSEPGKPLGALTLTRVLMVGGLAGDPGALNANFGGCLSIRGDASNPRTAAIRDSVLLGCNAGLILDSDSVPNVRGGALEARRAALTLERVLLARSSAAGTPAKGGRGGGAALLDGSTASWSDGVLAGNAATQGDPDLNGAGSSGSYERWTEAPPAAAGVLIAAPSRPVGGPFSGAAFLAFAWEDGSASLDGEPLPGAPRQGVVDAVEGDHLLEVAGLGGCARCATEVAAPVEPATTLVADPGTIAVGESATLEWATPAGEMLAALVDRGVGETGASGSAVVAPVASGTWRRFVVTRQGGAVAEAQVGVDETPLDPIFVDGFESGFAPWSVVAP